MPSFKPLLIHKDNTPIKCNSIDFKIDSFDFGNSDLDTYISQEFIPKIVEKDFNILFIKDNLSDNYLELYGITLAYHIRLSNELGDKRLVPIVIISDVDGYILNKLTPMANILFTKNTFVVSNEISSYDYFEKVFEQIQPFSDFKKEILDLIHIDPPQDYLSYHGISNEWSIYRWAEFLKVDTDATKTNKAKIENMLYFKYLKAKFPVEKKTGLSIVPKTPQHEGNILYIDDEWDKGWKDIFEKYFSKSTNITFHFINYIYKDTTYEAIKTLVQESLNLNPIDTVLLDMRLVKDDHEQKDVEELSGIKLLKLIKSFNPGIQVILLTASEKSTILDEANKYNILGYIKKESPSDDSTYTKEVFKNLKTLVDLGFERKYLKEIWNIQEKMLNIENIDEDVAFEVKSVFEILNSNIEKSLIFAMITIFKPLEFFKNSHEYNEQVILIINNELITVYEDNFIRDYDEYGFGQRFDAVNYSRSIKNKVWSLLFHRYNYKDMEVFEKIEEITSRRNQAMHGDFDYSSLSSKSIISWFSMLEKVIFEIYNEN